MKGVSETINQLVADDAIPAMPMHEIFASVFSLRLLHAASASWTILGRDKDSPVSPTALGRTYVQDKAQLVHDGRSHRGEDSDGPAHPALVAGRFLHKCDSPTMHAQERNRVAQRQAHCTQHNVAGPAALHSGARERTLSSGYALPLRTHVPARSTRGAGQSGPARPSRVVVLQGAHLAGSN